jgi:MoaA/NifB/PqqE/SkfB family radical SAM enzyme
MPTETVTTLFVGYRCVNACVFCAQGALRDAAPERPDAALRAELAAACAAPGFDGRIAFVGGEPLTRPELDAWAAEARRLGARELLVQTNGRALAEPGRAKRLAKAGATALDLSLHGSTPAMHDYHTGVPGSLAETAAGALEARRAGLELGVTTVVTRSNFRHLAEIARLARGLGAAALHLDLAERLGSAAASWERVVPDPAIAASGVAAGLAEARKLGLETLSAGRASGPAAARLFAGLGPVEPEAARASAEASRRPAEAPRRPAPALRETRAPSKKTGSELRSIFPGLFGAA